MTPRCERGWDYQVDLDEFAALVELGPAQLTAQANVFGFQLGQQALAYSELMAPALL